MIPNDTGGNRSMRICIPGVNYRDENWNIVSTISEKEMKRCECRRIPELIEIGKWPAQYKIECVCGREVTGPFFCSDDETYRHAAAKSAAIRVWNAELL